jgi:predicted DNA-binding transcriptional regulator AlpA
MLNNSLPRVLSEESIRSHSESKPPSLAWQPDSPILRLNELLKVVRVSRSKAYELMKTDPDFPKGIPLYDGSQSPKFYWTHEALAWVEARSNKFRNQSQDI